MTERRVLRKPGSASSAAQPPVAETTHDLKTLPLGSYPILLYGIGLAVRNAAGTGLLLLFVTVVAVEQTLRGDVSVRQAPAILIGSSVGARFDARTTYCLPS